MFRNGQILSSGSKWWAQQSSVRWLRSTTVHSAQPVVAPVGRPAASHRPPQAAGSCASRCRLRPSLRRGVYFMSDRAWQDEGHGRF